MALHLKGWIGVTVALCALVAWGNLPPDSMRRGWRVEPGLPPLPEAERFQAVAEEVVRTRGLLRRLRLADTLMAHAGARTAEGWSVEVRTTDPVPDTARESLEAAFLRDAATLPEPRPAGVVLGGWVVPADLGADEGPWDPAVQRTLTREILLATRDGTDYCIGVDRSPARLVDRAFTERDLLGTRRRQVLSACWWVGAYGFPGAGVADWLSDGGAVFANERPGAQRPAAAAWGSLGWWEPGRRRGLFGLGFRAPEVDGCLAGRTEACARIFRGPSLLGFAPVGRLADPHEEALTHPGVWWIGWPRLTGMGAWGWVLSDLHGDFGADRFRAFWTSPSDPETAFQEAFGVPAGTWMAAWATRHSGHVPPGPLPRTRALLWALAVLGAAAALSATTAHRRRAG